MVMSFQSGGHFPSLSPFRSLDLELDDGLSRTGVRERDRGPVNEARLDELGTPWTKRVPAPG
jgi:hypothetical protein